jgi:hypothetical protein
MLKVPSLRVLSFDLPAYPSLRQKNSAPQEQFAFEKEEELLDLVRPTIPHPEVKNLSIKYLILPEMSFLDSSILIFIRTCDLN